MLPCQRIFSRFLGLGRDFLLLLVAVSVGMRCYSAERQPAITRLADIRALSREEAAKGYPVKVKGVVTWRMGNTTAGAGVFTVSDGSIGVWVNALKAVKLGAEKKDEGSPEPLSPGTVVEIEGVGDSGTYSPIIMARTVRRTGTAPLPEPRRPSLERMLAGMEDCNWVEVEGVVQDVSRQYPEGGSALLLMMEGRPCLVWGVFNTEFDEGKYINARVRVRAIITLLPNLRSEYCGLRFNITEENDITVLDPPPRDPFQAPKVRPNRLTPFSPGVSPFHRKVTEGVVTYALPGRFLFIQDGKTGVLVESADKNVRPGERVAVSGFVSTKRTLASFEGASIRRLGPAAMPPAEPVTARRILSPDYLPPHFFVALEDFNGRLVRLGGVVRSVDRETKNEWIELWIESQGVLFSAHVEKAFAGGSAPVQKWIPGAEVEVTGVCQLDFSENLFAKRPYSINGFHLWLRAPEDVRVIRLPSWWTPGRLCMALLGIGAVLLLVLTWNFALRRLLNKRTGQFEEVMRSHRNVEIEYTSAQRERLRLAMDLHDGLRQLLAAASFRVDAASARLSESPDKAARHLEAAHNALSRTEAELQECLWGLHAVGDGPPDLVHLFLHVTERHETWPANAVFIHCEGAARQLSRHFVGSVLLLFQEAVGNAFKHGRATRIDVTVRYGGSALDLHIIDNGVGFDPASAPDPRAGHFGLHGMRKRVQWLEGTLRISPHAAGGMEIHARFPWSRITGGIPAPDEPPASGKRDDNIRTL